MRVQFATELVPVQHKTWLLCQVLWGGILLQVMPRELILAIRQSSLEGGRPTRLPLGLAAQAA